MLKPVVDMIFHYNEAHGCYKLMDEQGRYYWLNGGIFLIAIQECQKAEPSWTWEECREFVLSNVDEDMKGVEEDEGDMPYHLYSLNTAIFGDPITDEEATAIETAINDRLKEYEVNASVTVSKNGTTIGDALPAVVDEHVMWVFNHLTEILNPSE